MPKTPSMPVRRGRRRASPQDHQRSTRLTIPHQGKHEFCPVCPRRFRPGSPPRLLAVCSADRCRLCAPSIRATDVRATWLPVAGRPDGSDDKSGQRPLPSRQGARFVDRVRQFEVSVLEICSPRSDRLNKTEYIQGTGIDFIDQGSRRVRRRTRASLDFCIRRGLEARRPPSINARQTNCCLATGGMNLHSPVLGPPRAVPGT